LSWLRFELGGVGRLDLEETDPCLKIQKLILLGGGDTACFKGDLEKGLALRGDKFVERKRSAIDLSHALGGWIDAPFGCPVSKEYERDADYGEEDQKKAF